MHPLPHIHLQSRSVTVLGSTGSIGTSALDVLTQNRHAFQVMALTAQDNVALLAAQAKAIGAKRAVIGNEAHFLALKSALSGTGIEAAAGSAAIVEAAQLPADIVIAGIVGNAGLMPTLAAVKCGAIVALANKESLVCAGNLLLEEVRRSGATLLPVDSEHSAIFQVFNFQHPEAVEKIVLTASGGPFRTMSYEDMRRVTPEQAMKHPNWNMGAKISVDSATMMNKALECIEAFYLFPVKAEQIEVLVHPESIIHGMVYYTDGSVLAQLGMPDMRTPIAHALAWPERMHAPSPRLDFKALKSLTFEAPDETRFPALSIGRQALAAGGTAPTLFNAANEIAVARFIRKEIAFTAIVNVIQETLTRFPASPVHSIEDVLEADRTAKQFAESSPCTF
jgi:1-deoxy-D-xylulose-5-phosphate reductoisomerase